MKQYAPACDRNSEPILAVLKEIFTAPGEVLEIGSGTGQHAVYFARGLPHVTWRPSDLPANHASIRAWREEAALPNLREPIVVDLAADDWPDGQVKSLVCINTIHIVAWPLVENLFTAAGRILEPGGILYAYGPYRYPDRPLEPSNEKFDRWLKDRDPDSGVRDFKAVDTLARSAGLELKRDLSMPANNRSLWWYKL
jgi:SAM-dependent methyltransferase